MSDCSADNQAPLARRRWFLLPLLLLLLATTLAAAAEPAQPTPTLPTSAKRIVCLGDSITDGHTYPLLVQAALRAAGKPVPVMINAGVGGDTAEGMLKRLDRDVLARGPELVLLSVGINDFGTGVSLPDFEARVAKILDELAAQHVPVVLLTTSAVRHQGATAELDRRNAALRQLAEQKHVPVGDVADSFAKGIAAEEDLWEADGSHLNFAGYRRMARGVLDGLGYPAVAVPEKLEVELLPDVIRSWQLRRAPDDQPLDAAGVAALAKADGWKPYAVPETEPVESWWFNQERQRGFAVTVKKRIGEGDRFQGIAEVTSPTERPVYFRPGADLKRIWLNGEKIYDGSGSWHIREEVPAKLLAGTNTVVIETGPMFFVGIVDKKE